MLNEWPDVLQFTFFTLNLELTSHLMTSTARRSSTHQRQQILSYATGRLSDANSVTRSLFSVSRRFRGLYMACCQAELNSLRNGCGV